MATIIPFPDQPNQPLKRQVSLPPGIVAHLAEITGEDLDLEIDREGEAQVTTGQLFEMLNVAAKAAPETARDGTT